MIYEIHLYAPKRGVLTPAALEWLFEHGQSLDQPEVYWPVRKIRPRALARLMLRLDTSLIAVPGPGDDVELHYPDERLGIVLYAHDRGLIVFFPYMVYTMYSQIVLRICYTYIRYLYDAANFWSYDPQLNVLSYADDFYAIEETARMMDKLLHQSLPSGSNDART